MSDTDRTPGTVFDEYTIEYDGDIIDVVDRINDDGVCVEEYHLPDGTVSVSYRPVIRCEHCRNEWGTTSHADRPSCSLCNRKTDRQTLGKYHETYLKYALFTGEETETEAVASILRGYAEQFELMQANGWRLDSTTQSSAVAMSKGDAPPQDLIG